jgi:Glycine cleavage system protein P (pyridoxal-binding), N-terminal domain
MNYIPHTKEDISKMLSVVGCSTVDELVSEFKPRLSELNLNNPMSEMELVAYMTSLSEKNSQMKCFSWRRFL